MAANILRDKQRDGEPHEDAVAYSLTRPVDLETLEAELAEALEWDEGAEVGFVSEGDTRQASEDHPIEVWVLHPGIEPATLRSAVAKHELPPVQRSSRIEQLLERLDKADPSSPEAVEATHEAVVILLQRASLGL